VQADVTVYALVSAKGSPGVTTTVVALTRTWSAVTGKRALGLDLDPSGGDVGAGVLRGAPPASGGVLALATRRDEPAVQAVLASSADLGAGDALVLPGVPDAARSAAIPLAWDVVAAALPDLGAAQTDVLIDGGRLDGAQASPTWMGHVDLAVVVVRPTLPSVTAAHRLANAWPASPPLAMVVIEAPSPYTTREVRRALALPLVEVLPFDPSSAAVHSDGSPPGRRYRRGAYARSLDRLIAAMTRRADEWALARPPAVVGVADPASAGPRSVGGAR
jgi:MinD-like ATPase involved in chromosome partitioning or flagellar assembly